MRFENVTNYWQRSYLKILTLFYVLNLIRVKGDGTGAKKHKGTNGAFVLLVLFRGLW